jgi:hypothetical protein
MYFCSLIHCGFTKSFPRRQKPITWSVIKMTKSLLLILSLLFSLSYLIFNPTWAYSTKNGNIYDSKGNQVSIDGIAWIGFQDSNFLGGLWNVGFNAMGSNFGVSQLLSAPWSVPSSNISSASNGVSFKTIRLPIQPGIWGSAATVQSSPFDFALTDVNNQDEGNGPFCDWTKGSDSSGHCIQSKTAPNLLTAVINEFNTQGVLVMLDFHHRPGLGDNFRDGTVVASNYTLQNYHDDVANFAKSAAANILGIDIYNEPHQLYWYQDNTAVSPTQPAWIKVIAAAAAATYDNNQNLLLFVEGPNGSVNDPFDPVYSSSKPICLASTTKVDDTSQISLTKDASVCTSAAFPMHLTNLGVNWGENFRSLLDQTQRVNGVAKFDVTTFRSMLISAIETNNFSTTAAATIANWLLGTNNDDSGGHLVFAPHLYGSEVAGWQTDWNDSQIRFKWNFGFLLDAGFPFVVGELGFNTQEPTSGGEDFFLNSVTPYLISKNLNHNLFFWTLNNADSPVGLRTDDSALGLFAWKELDLHNLFSSSTTQQFGSLCVTVPTPSGYTGKSFPVVTVMGSSSYTFNLTAFNTKTCLSNVLTGAYTLTGSTITNADGINYFKATQTSATVTNNTETDVSLSYTQAATGTLKVNVTGGTGCTISTTQQFKVTYSTGATTGSVTATGTTAVSAAIPVGSYTITVSPTTLPSNTSCTPQYTPSVTIAASTTTQEAINYTVAAPSTCSVKAQCSTWGSSGDSWAGSSCNFNITSPTGLANPTTFTLNTTGITSLTGVWNATGTLTNGTTTLVLTDPVSVPSMGFNAAGVITLPTQANLVSNGKSYLCALVS